MKKFIFPIVTVLFFALSCAQTQSNAVSGGMLAPDRFKVVMDSINDEQLVDVRTPDEFSGGHIDGAQNIDWKNSNFGDQSSKLDKNKPVMVYCLGGGRSAEAVDFLRKNGFTTVYELQGGVRGWTQAQLPLVTEGQAPEPSASLITPGQYSTLIHSKSIVLADFSATWCGPCQRLAPRLDELEKELAGKFLLVRMDADRDSKAADSLNITALPTLLLYKDGKLVWRNEGLVDKETIADQIKAAEKK